MHQSHLAGPPSVAIEEMHLQSSSIKPMSLNASNARSISSQECTSIQHQSKAPSTTSTVPSSVPEQHRPALSFLLMSPGHQASHLTPQSRHPPEPLAAAPIPQAVSTPHGRPSPRGSKKEQPAIPSASDVSIPDAAKLTCALASSSQYPLTRLDITHLQSSLCVALSLSHP